MKRFSAILAFLLALAAPFALGVDINGQLKKAQLEQQSADPAAATARVYFNTLTNTAKIYNGTAWTSLGSGAGSGEKNYVSNGSSSAVGWAASSGNITCATTTSNMPDPSLGTALAVTGVSGSTDFCYTNFTLDDADFAKKLKLAWDQYAVSNTSADFRVDVCACAVAWSGGACSAGTVAQGCGTNSTRLPLSTDSSSASLLPALTGSYRTTYDAIGASKKYMQVQVGLAQTNTHQVNLANIVSGPGIVTQGAAVTQWQTFTPTGAWTTNTTYSGWYRRVGDSVQARVHVALTGAPNAATALLVNLPLSLTTNGGALFSNASSIGTWSSYHAATLAVNLGDVNIGIASSNNVQLEVTGSGGSGSYLLTTTNPVSWANGDQIDIDFTVPVNEWTGSGTVNLAYSGTATATVSCDTPNGHGSTNTKIRRYTNCTSTGTAITYADSATLGASYTINEPGVYSMTTSDKNSAAADVLGLSVNTSAPTTAIQSISTSERLLMFEGTTNSNASGSVTAKLNAGDVVRVHDDGTPNSAAAYSIMKIAKVVNDPTGAVGFANATSTSAGLVMGQKQYVVGTAYTNGTPAVTSGNAGWTVQRGIVIPYQTSDGAWRLKFSLSATFTSTSTSAVTLFISGVTYKTSTNFYQAGSGIWFGSAQGAQSYATAGGNTWTVTSSSAATVTGLACAGDVELDSKPTWAD